ncbi:hypothetical protein MC885_017118 [Smutsia gigantea]|nr:hypothetical protein MC885_017118 [Smutsia gigantea]
MSDTEKFSFLDPALQYKAMKRMDNLENVKRKVIEMVELGKRKKQMKLTEKWKHPEQTDVKDSSSLRQCLGPHCVHSTRPGSKYCSDDCGMKLAAERIFLILPQRIQQWQMSPCIAEEHGKKMLECIHHEQQDTQAHLKKMECDFHELEALILHGKQQSVCKDEEINNSGKNRADQQIFCVSCGKQISMHVALHHMESCFIKVGNLAGGRGGKGVFGWSGTSLLLTFSIHFQPIPRSTRLFCDVYDPQSKRYCKRLKVLCPEHSKNPKVPEDEVCGCPLVHNVFELTGDFCRLPKRLCNRHYCWEKLRRAEVDLERVRAMHKLEKLDEQEKKVRTAMKNRAGLLGLMLHKTIQHDPLTPNLCSGVDN